MAAGRSAGSRNVWLPLVVTCILGCAVAQPPIQGEGTAPAAAPREAFQFVSGPVSAPAQGPAAAPVKGPGAAPNSAPAAASGKASGEASLPPAAAANAAQNTAAASGDGNGTSTAPPATAAQEAAAAAATARAAATGDTPKKSKPGSLGARGTACCARLAAIGFTPTIPVLIVDTNGQQFDRSAAQRDLKVNACTCGADKPGYDWTGTLQMSHRGGENSNLRNVLRSYNVKLFAKSSFLALPSEKNFAIYQPQNDTLGLRQWLAFRLARDTGKWTPKTTYIETFINTAGGALSLARDYVGLQLAMQTVIRDDNNVPISKTTASTPPADSGYILEYEHGQVRNGTTAVVGSTTRQPWNIRYPKLGTITNAQKGYVGSALNAFEQALYAPNFADPAAGWRKFGNDTTFVDWFLEAELMKNTKHTYHGASYMYKDAAAPLEMGAQWSMSQSFGFCCGYPIEGYKTGGKDPFAPGKSGGAAIAPQGWLFNICDDQQRCVSDPTLGLAVWFRQLWRDPAFRTAAAKKFLQLRAAEWSDATVGGAIDNKHASLRPAGNRTLTKYVPLGIIWAPGSYPTVAAGYDDKFATLRKWVLARLSWMEGQLKQVVAGNIPPQLAPMAPNLALRSRAEGDFATGQAAVTPQNRFIAPPLQTATTADAAAGGG